MELEVYNKVERKGYVCFIVLDLENDILVKMIDVFNVKIDLL